MGPRGPMGPQGPQGALQGPPEAPTGPPDPGEAGESIPGFWVRDPAGTLESFLGAFFWESCRDIGVLFWGNFLEFLSGRAGGDATGQVVIATGKSL